MGQRDPLNFRANASKLPVLIPSGRELAMKTSKTLVGAVALLATIGFASPSYAGSDIPWTWNSGDHDSKGKFKSYGDDFKGRGYHGTNYIDWSSTGYGYNRWWIYQGSTQTLNLNFPEGNWVGMEVCQENVGWPDDCSAWKSGRA